MTPSVFLPAMPLRSYWASLPKEDRIKYETLEELARDGKLLGAYKQGRTWFINLLAHAQMGIESESRGKIEEAEDETETPTSQGDGHGDPPGEHVVRPPKKRRPRRSDGGVRHRR